MSCRSWRFGMLLLVAVLAVYQRPLPANPLADLIPFHKIDADPKKSYRLTAENGPWLVMASSFAGEGAHEEAQELVLELRRRFKMKAYTFTKHFDYTQRDMPGIGLYPSGRPVRMRYYNDGEFDEVAVLVGDFEAVDDPRLQKTLEKIKYARPACLNLNGKKGTTQRFAGLREFHRLITPDREKKLKGPMRHALAAPNPLLPKEYFAPKGPDKLVVEMNRDVEHSLLDCSGKYTVRVATFRGQVILDQKKISEIENGKEFDYKLAEAAEKAHRLAQCLRKQGIEAYEFHDRNQSIVTVGSFNSVGKPLPDGRTELHPAIQRIMESFGPARISGQLDGVQQVGLQPRGLEGIPFDVSPLPIEVPRRSIAQDYARRSFFP